jgi:hypothetical protein
MKKTDFCIQLYGFGHSCYVEIFPYSTGLLALTAEVVLNISQEIYEVPVHSPNKLCGFTIALQIGCTFEYDRKAGLYCILIMTIRFWENSLFEHTESVNYSIWICANEMNAFYNLESLERKYLSILLSNAISLCDMVL